MNTKGTATIPFLGALALVVIVAVVSVIVITSRERDGQASAPIVPTSGQEDSGELEVEPEPGTLAREVVIANNVTSGLEIREDRPAYLSQRPENFCKLAGCALENTDMVTGDDLVVTCQTVGPRTTNGDDTTAGDDHNPELFESRLWYGARWPDGRFGFLSEVWVHEDFRGGLELPLC